MTLNWRYSMDEYGHISKLNPSKPENRIAIRTWQRLQVLVTKIFGLRNEWQIP